MTRQSHWKLIVGTLTIVSFLLAARGTVANAQSARTQKPNILFIMGDDIGWMQVGVYHRGIGIGETPNIDRLAREGGWTQRLSNRNVSVTYRHDPATTSRQPVLSEARHPVARRLPA